MLNNIIGHDSVKISLRSALKELPPIILFSGPKGVGKKFTAINLIDEIYKGSVKLQDHPDVKIYTPDGDTFKIGLVHEVQKDLMYTPFELDKKFFILSNVDRMNKEAANASLKMLEDSTENTHFILTCENLESVLSTIRSRSAIFQFYGVPNIEAHFPNITPICAKLANGCIGNLGEIGLFDLEGKYNLSLKEFSNFDKLSYSEVLDFYKKVTYDSTTAEILLDAFILAAQNLADSKKYTFLKEFLDFKHKLKLNLNHETHLKLCLLNIRKLLEDKNV